MHIFHYSGTIVGNEIVIELKKTSYKRLWDVRFLSQLDIWAWLPRQISHYTPSHKCVITWDAATFSLIYWLFGSTWQAYFRLATVYSCPQYTLCNIIRIHLYVWRIWQIKHIMNKAGTGAVHPSPLLHLPSIVKIKQDHYYPLIDIGRKTLI